jgi:lipoyl(octanoyl) transferase
MTAALAVALPMELQRVSGAIHFLGQADYTPTLAAMRAFSEARTADTPDQIWLCQHPPVYTQGLSGKPEHVLNPQGIPVVQTNRGGQVTYHGPGQVVAYPLIDLKRLNIYVKEYVFRVEQAVIKTLEHFGVTGHRVTGAPGIYVRLDDPFGHSALDANRLHLFDGLGKIAALGIKVARHCTYHGVALNVAMDLQPFHGINPCGYAGLQTVDLSTIGVQVACDEVAEVLGSKLVSYLSP